MKLTIRALEATDVTAADRVYRLAFGTLLGLSDPSRYRGDADLIRGRTRVYPDGSFVAEQDGTILGVSLANNWGSLGILGPVAVHPDFWRQGIARRLVARTLEAFTRWDSRIVGLFTFPDAAHLTLYQGFGFWPRYLVSVMTRAVDGRAAAVPALSLGGKEPQRRAALVAACTALAATLLPGLDLGREIEILTGGTPGDVLMLEESGEIAGFALCHCGPGSEGGTQSCYVKFAMVRSGAAALRDAGRRRDRLRRPVRRAADRRRRQCRPP